MFLTTRNGTLAALLCIAWQSPAVAIEFEALFMLQSTLNDHGFDAGDPDGRMGGRTRSAIEGFAAAYGAPTDPDDLIGYMIQLNARHAEAITDPEILELVRIGVGRNLRDPESAQVRNVRRVTGHDGGKFICGEVNGKNAYGGYAGFIAFGTTSDASSFMGYDSLIYMVASDSNYTFWRCLLAFPRSEAS